MNPKPDTLTAPPRRWPADPTHFPNNLAQLCRERNITQVSLARELDVTPQTINRWARGVRSPTWPEIHRLCRLLSCDLQSLVKLP